MNLYKFYTYLSYVGCVLIALYLIISLALYHTGYGFKESNVLRCLLFLSVSFMIPLWCYKLYHFKAFKEENQNRIIHWVLLIIVVIASIIYKRIAT